MDTGMTERRHEQGFGQCSTPNATHAGQQCAQQTRTSHAALAGRLAESSDSVCGRQRGELRFWFTGRAAGRCSGTILNRSGLTGAVHRAAVAAKGAAKSVPGRACAADRDPRSPRCRLRWLGAFP
jgi:hypothetical protein